MRGKPVPPQGVGQEPGIIPARAGKTARDYRARSSRPDHPRACGENALRSTNLPGVPGSSPRVRGKRPHRRPDALGDRIIPARAGKTYSKPPARSSPRDHPRACGENGTTSTRRSLSRGSSPRVRGKRRRPRRDGQSRGIIPARAGKTEGERGLSLGLGDHPRACGENSWIWSWQRVTGGSSPRVRGKRSQAALHAAGRGIIPARAGKTRPRRAPPRSRPDHPRACGENIGDFAADRRSGGSSPRVRGKQPRPRRAERGAGSSPRVRGKPPVLPGPFDDGRLIPARAGKTTTRPPCSTAVTAHPRACGENIALVWAPVASSGSSPRVRGKRSFALPCGFPPEAHPRACGENAYNWVKNLFSGGSSPRVRGKRPSLLLWGLGRRLIPARAGKTSTSSTAGSPASAHPRACGENRRRR